MVKIGMMIADRYEVLEKIGTGGMSDVYKATDHKLNRNVAVKVLKQEFSENENFVSKFRVEAQAAAGLMHPNIVNVYDVGEESGIHYIVMELVEGITLKKYIEKKQRLTVKEAVSIAIQVGMGLEAAHNNHIIHRDIKPQNIIISKEGKVKVTDFGIAKAASSNTITSNVMGSVHYTSPEQARGGYSDAKSDIYSLGVTLFEMLTGRVPFNGETTVAIAIKHIQEPMPDPKEFSQDVPISVEKIVLKCCQKSPDRRYQTAGELITDLKKSLITPEEDFVDLKDPDTDGETRPVTDEERNSIKMNTMGMATGLRLNEDTYDEEPGDFEDREVLRPREQGENGARRRRQSAGTGAKHSGNKRSGKNTEAADKGMEKATIAMAVAAAVIVGILLIFLLSRGFGTSGSNEQGLIATDTSSQPVEDPQDDGITIPNVVGKTYAEARVSLEEKGFVVRKDPAEASGQGIVGSQSPAGGESGRNGSTVTLYVGDPAQVTPVIAPTDASTEASTEETSEVVVPNVLGKTEEEATVILIEEGLSVGRVTPTAYADERYTDKICNQSIGSGTRVAKGTVINLEISTGPAAVTYSYIADIEGPTEDPLYNPSIPVKVNLQPAEGRALLNTTTSSFPISVTYRGITTPTGMLTFTFTVTTEETTQTNAETGEVTTIPAKTEEHVITRNVVFDPE